MCTGERQPEKEIMINTNLVPRFSHASCPSRNDGVAMKEKKQNTPGIHDVSGIIDPNRPESACYTQNIDAEINTYSHSQKHTPSAQTLLAGLITEGRTLHRPARLLLCVPNPARITTRPSFLFLPSSPQYLVPRALCFWWPLNAHHFPYKKDISIFFYFFPCYLKNTIFLVLQPFSLRLYLLHALFNTSSSSNLNRQILFHPSTKLFSLS